MFFFFAGGLEQQVRQVVKSGVGRCINCNSRADLVEYDKVLKLFFVPVWRCPGKDNRLYCQDCKFLFPQSYSLPSPPPSNGGSALPEALRCRYCDRDVAADFAFCPYCGTQL
ncbi:hypothetical protein P8452_06661 [Trifolium repens]|nr:hypothetical protein P8452_06661 [Trifolium repens]